MNWVKYGVKTSLVQIVRDIKEYRGLKQHLRFMEKRLGNAVTLLTREYDVDDDIKCGDACLKHKEIIEATNMFDDSACRYIMSRCKFFEPIGDEKICPNKQCVCWNYNKQYNQTLSQIKELQGQVSGFWAEKFENVK